MTRVGVEKWIEHPRWQNDELDVGLVVANESLQLTNEIRAAFPSTWKLDGDDLIQNKIPLLLCGYGVDQNDEDFVELECIRYRFTNKKCLRYYDHPEYDWCAYTGLGPEGPGTWQIACSGDSGAGLFPGEKKMILLKCSLISWILF